MGRDEDGFTLVEVIVALVVATASIASLYQIYTFGWRAVRTANLEAAALVLAQNQLAAAGVETPLAEGSWSGELLPGLRWTSRIQPYVTFEGAFEDIVARGAYWVDVRVEWADGGHLPARSLHLTTIKIGKTP